jgi:hypothetical protein
MQRTLGKRRISKFRAIGGKQNEKEGKERKK